MKDYSDSITNRPATISLVYDDKLDAHVRKICTPMAKRFASMFRAEQKEDFLQMVCARVYQKLGSYDRKAPFDCFVLVIAKNIFVDYIRSRNVLSLEEELIDEDGNSKKVHVYNQNVVIGPFEPNWLGHEDIFTAEKGNGFGIDTNDLLSSSLTEREEYVIRRIFGIGEFISELPLNALADNMGLDTRTVIKQKNEALNKIRTKLSLMM